MKLSYSLKKSFIFYITLSAIIYSDPIKLNTTLNTNEDVSEFKIVADNIHIVYIANPGFKSELFSVPIDGSSNPVKISGNLIENGDVKSFKLNDKILINSCFNSTSCEQSVIQNAVKVVYLADQLTNGVNELFSVPVNGATPPINLSGDLVTGGNVTNYKISSELSSSDFLSANNHVVFLADKEKNNTFELYSVPIHGNTNPVKISGTLVSGGNVTEKFAITDDGTRVIYIADQDQNNMFELYSVQINGNTTPVKISGELTDSGNVIDFDIGDDIYFSELGNSLSEYESDPEKIRVLYLADQTKDGVVELYSVPRDGRSLPVKISGDLTAFGNVTEFKVSNILFDDQLKSDGSFIVYLADQDENEVFELYSVLRAGGTTPVKLNPNLSVGNNITDFQMSETGLRVVYAINTFGISHLYSCDITGSGSPIKLSGDIVNGGTLLDFKVSNFTENAVYRANKEDKNFVELFTVPLDGTSSSVKLNSSLPIGSDVDTFEISFNGESVIYLADQEMRNVIEIYNVPIGGGTTPSKLNGNMTVGGKVTTIGISNNNCNIAYIADQNINDHFEIFGSHNQNTKPSFNIISSKTGDEEQLLSFSISATDPDLPLCQTLLYTLSDTPFEEITLDSNTGLINWTPTEVDGPGTYEITVTVTDNAPHPLTDEMIISIQVDEVNSHPVISQIDNQTVEANKFFSLQINASDPDIPAQVLNYELIENPPVGAKITNTTGLFTWSPEKNHSGVDHIVKVKVTDDGTEPLSSTETFTISVIQIYSLITSVTGCGTVSPNSGEFNELSQVTITAIPEVGYEFIKWEGDIPDESKTTNPLTINVNDNKIIRCVFGITVSEDWLTEYFGTTTVTLEDDFDSDGFSNRKEFEIGTHPKENSPNVPVAINLAKGWNLVSLPIQIEKDSDFNTLIGNSAAIKEWTWNNWAKHYEKVDQMFNRLGYWVYSNTNIENKVISGHSILEQSTKTLFQGWNLVGVWPNIDYPTNNNIIGSIWYWDSDLQNFRSLNVQNQLLPGIAYWIYSVNKTEL